MKTTAELREGFLSYFESKGHTRHPSGSLVPPEWDRSTLLTSAGVSCGRSASSRLRRSAVTAAQGTACK